MTNAGDQAAGAQRAHGAALAMTVICAAQFVLQLDFSIVNVALPTIQRELHMAAAQLQWIVTGYALTFGSLLLAGGRWPTCSGGAGCWPPGWSGSRSLPWSPGRLEQPAAHRSC